MRLIDADRLNAVVNETLETLVMLPVFSLQEVHLKTAFQTLTDMINNAPTIDAVPVVRCKDCRYSDDYYIDGGCYCKHPEQGMRYIGTNWNWYCADGERKEDE